MLILKTTVLLQVLVISKVLAANEVVDIEGRNELIKKYRKLSKIRKLSKSGNSKSKILFKSKNPCLISIMKERNFFTFDAKTDFRF